MVEALKVAPKMGHCDYLVSQAVLFDQVLVAYSVLRHLLLPVCAVGVVEHA